ncbi:hypothetical protein SAMD00023353_6900440 [Rosellinia necatrix]|uniref:AA1-like domain-containing protein n=1 Tax=Rosellinia necatrix TaxID=77044 RepID=A0A1W2TT15_ROSNE|nr:hypothetical protein SAMD00023353_6900440 [Rosellinia necatrix]
MKTFALLTCLLLGATATPVKQRQAITQAQVSGFAASTNPNGDGATIAYDFEIPGVLATHCAYEDSTSGSTLPAVPLTTRCDDPAVRWQFRQDPSIPGTEGRYRIVVVRSLPDSAAEEAGFYEWPASDFPLVEAETVYQGASDFTIDLS